MGPWAKECVKWAGWDATKNVCTTCEQYEQHEPWGINTMHYYMLGACVNVGVVLIGYGIEVVMKKTQAAEPSSGIFGYGKRIHAQFDKSADLEGNQTPKVLMCNPI